MDAAVILGAGLMGLAGAPHCAAMCGAPCAAVTQRCGNGARNELMTGFMLGRLLSYAAGGAAVAASVSAVNMLGTMTPALRPVWTLLHLAVLGLGLWLLATGRQPAWWARLGNTPAIAAPPPPGWQRMAAPLRAGAAGGLLVALPCGLLQSALLVAALANTPLNGALAMASFAAASSIGLWLPGTLSARAGNAQASVLMLRLAGATLAAASVWALTHDLWLRWSAWCQTVV